MRGGSGPYYYRKVRGADGRVRSVYVGKGLVAEACAAQDGAVRAGLAYRNAAVGRAVAALDGSGDAVSALTAAVRMQLGASMEAAGFRYHRGEWRRPRVAAADHVQPSVTAPAATVGVLAAAEPATRAGAALDSLRPRAQHVQSDSSPSGLDVHYPEELTQTPRPEAPRIAVDGPSTEHLLSLIISEAWSLRILAELVMHHGEGDRAHPVYRAFMAGAIGTAESWGERVMLPAMDDLPAAEKRYREGRLALGQAACHQHWGRPDHAALAVAAVLDEAGVDGRRAVTAVVERVRRKHGWAGLPAVGRAVIDQLALAYAHFDLVCAFKGTSAPARSRAAQTPSGPDLLDQMREFLVQMVGSELVEATVGCLDAETPKPRPGGTEDAWTRRRRRARRRLTDAARLLRHARKAGLLEPAGDAAPTSAETAPDADVLLAALAAAPPLPPMVGASADHAAAERRRIDGMRAAWPPPARIRHADLYGDGVTDIPYEKRLWCGFCYEPDFSEIGADDDLDGFVDGDRWLFLTGDHETPERAEARLAEWAPEYVDPGLGPGLG